MTAMTLSTLKSLRNDSMFGLFWQRVTASANYFGVDKPVLTHRRKAPCRFDDGSTPTVHETVEDRFRVVYFEALDLIISCIEDRFDQPGYKTYGKVQALLLKAVAKYVS